MPDRERIAQLADLADLREAQTAAAMEALRKALADEAVAQSTHDLQAAARNEAIGDWNRLLSEAKPDPGLVGIGAAWMVKQQQQLKSEELNLSIAQNQTELSRNGHAQALAQESAIREIGAEARKAMHKHKVERFEMQMADQFLWSKER